MMGAVKRELENKTDAVLDAVRLTGAAVLVERQPTFADNHTYFALNRGAEPTLLRTLEIARSWMAGPKKEDEDRLHELRVEIQSWKAGAPPDMLIDYEDLLVSMVDEFIGVLEEWFSAYDLTVGWNHGALIVTRKED